MKFRLSSSLVRKSLSAHSWLGLLVGALMYLVCLTGTLAVFYEEFERWEQPYAEEYRSFDPEAVETTFNAWLGSGIDVTEHMYLVLPTEAVPRMRVASETESRFLDADGTLAAEERNQWTSMLLDLHLYLHLPKSWGMILVSALGAMLCALIVSGLLAHPRIFKDAFNFRPGGSRHLEQADIHNRLSVWALPFHLMIAVTGAYFGLALPLLAVFAQAFHDGDREAVIATVFGEEPELQQELEPLAIASSLRQLETLAPDADPFLVTVHDAGTPAQFIAVSAAHPGRLVYSENYRFDASGRYLGTDGFLDGAAGRQVIYSIYRLHFGHFAGLPVKAGYGLLGLALSIVAVTGVNVWLARRKTRDRINDAWAGIVWGTPVALVLSALSQVCLGISAAASFWLVLAAAVAFSLARADERESARWLQRAFAGACAVLIAAYIARFGEAAATPAAIVLNASVLTAAVAFLLLARTRRKQHAVSGTEPLLQGRTDC